jgi:hypothetical protein
MRSFNSLEELFAAQREAEAAAQDEIPEGLRERISWGTPCISPRPDFGVIIFGRVSTEDELREKEDEHTLESLRDAHERGYRFGWWHSVIEIEGEPGSQHLVNLWPISPEQYAEARRAEWVPQRLPWLREVLIEMALAHG